MGHVGELSERAAEASSADASFRMASLIQFVSLVSAARGYSDLLRVMATESRHALEAASVSLSIWERDRGGMRTLVNVGELGPHQTEMPVDEVYRLSEHPLAERMTVEGVGYVQQRGGLGGDPKIEEVLLNEEKHSCLGVPVLFEGRVWGELWATRTDAQPPYVEGDLDFARLVAAQVGAGIAQAEHLARVERLAYTDDLTGLANRRAFEDRLDDALAGHRRDGRPVGIVVVDVNGLKRINDRLGHIVGDSALLTFAGELSAAASTVPDTLAARLGGDEFCLLTVGAGADEVVRLAEDVCRRADDVLDEGVACGVATTDELPAVGVTPSRLLRAADAAQYRAKRSAQRHPVVAGRTATPTGRIDPEDPDATDRRRFRGRGSLDPGQLLDELMRRLDAADDRDSLSRLRVVSATVAETLDAASWWISSVSPGDEHVVTRESGVVRRPGDQAADEYYEPEAYKLDDYPATYAALTGHCVLVDVDDPRSDPAETSLLMLAGMSEMVMCGGRDTEDHRWLVEVLGDDLSAPMRIYGSVLRAGIALALRR
jgi:diguanylate cyclase (GGDEF)-like protein